MHIKTVKDEDFNCYKLPHMTIAFPYCTFKCDKECGKVVCQNSKLAKFPNIEIAEEDLVGRYISNFVTSAVVLAGLEPFDSWNDLQSFVREFRKRCDDDIVIYTGYTKEEISGEVAWLSQFSDIIIKFGRFIPNQEKHFDEILGVELASDNQYAESVS